MFVAVALMMTASAQKTEKQVATLQHGDKTFVFYGINAFKLAYDAAADTLDVINLSSGEFNGPDYIEKSIAVYGAGFENDTIIGIPKTCIKGTHTILANSVHLEGISFLTSLSNEMAALTIGLNEDSYYSGKKAPNYNPIYNLSIVKCQLKTLWFCADSYNGVIRQSYLYNFIGSYRARQKYYPSLGPQVFMHNFLVSNNFIQGIQTSYINNSLNNGSRSFFDFDASSTIYVDHCILMSSMMEGDWHYTNNIINDFGIGGYHNIFFGNGTTYRDDNGNWHNVSPEEIWSAEGEDGKYSEKKDFALKNPEIYVGTDYTQIGLHGGVYAWNKIPTLPRITECIIDTKNVADGILKVSIKAEAQIKE